MLYNISMEKENFDPILESEIQQLARRVESKRDEVNFEAGAAVRESVSERIAEVLPEAKREFSILPGYAAEIPAEMKLRVEQIVDQFWHDGNLLAATTQAQKAGGLALDLFHDLLSGWAHDILKSKGLL